MKESSLHWRGYAIHGYFQYLCSILFLFYYRFVFRLGDETGAWFECNTQNGQQIQVQVPSKKVSCMLRITFVPFTQTTASGQPIFSLQP